MAEDIGPGTVVERYRGKGTLALFPYGSKWTVKEVFHDPQPCQECLPGYEAPGMTFVEALPPWTTGWIVCSCSFRPIRRPPRVIPPLAVDIDLSTEVPTDKPWKVFA